MAPRPDSPASRAEGAPGPPRVVLYAAADLIWATRIKSAADALGITSRPVRSLEMLEARLAEYVPANAAAIGGLIVDLEAADLALALIHRLRTPQAAPAERAIRIIAFGPHVATEALAAATAAGADSVLPRGGFSARLEAILRSLALGD